MKLVIPATLPPQPIFRLVACGRALFGNRWQSSLAKAMEVDRRTIVRWVAAVVPTPDDLDERLAGACRRRAEQMKTDAGKMFALASYLEAEK